MRGREMCVSSGCSRKLALGGGSGREGEREREAGGLGPKGVTAGNGSGSVGGVVGLVRACAA